MNSLALAFTICAVVGGALFVIRLVLQFVAGVDHDAVDVSDSGSDLDVSNSDISFKLLSLQGITAFLMMFGLAGRALLIDSRTGPVVALLGAVVAGGVSVWVIMKLFAFMKGLQSRGEAIGPQMTVGQSGTVYLNIPPDGIGKVNVSVQGRVKEFQAKSNDKEPLATGTNIKVVEVTGDGILVVARA